MAKKFFSIGSCTSRGNVCNRHDRGRILPDNFPDTIRWRGSGLRCSPCTNPQLMLQPTLHKTCNRQDRVCSVLLDPAAVRQDKQWDTVRSRTRSSRYDSERKTCWTCRRCRCEDSDDTPWRRTKTSRWDTSCRRRTWCGGSGPCRKKDNSENDAKNALVLWRQQSNITLLRYLSLIQTRWNKLSTANT